MIGIGGNCVWNVAGPGGIATGLELWLRADRGTLLSTGVNFWGDQSGKGRDASQPTTASQPTLTTNSANGQPGLTFDNSNDFLAGRIFYPVVSGTSLFRNNSLTVLVVAKQNTTGSHGLWDDTTIGGNTNTGHLLLQSGAGSRALRLGSLTDRASYAFSSTTTTCHIGVFEQPTKGLNGTYTQYEGTTQKATETPGGATGDIAIVQYRVGRLFQDTFPFDGDINEVAIWSIALNSDQRLAVSTYCNQKYGTAL